MSARKKLNQAFVNGSLLLAGVVGAVTGSWVVFGLALSTLVASSFYTGEIRFPRRKR